MSFPVDIDDIIKALSNPARREILGWLKEPEANFSAQEYPLENGVCVGRIFERAGLSQSTVSAHMAVLQRAGLVTSTRIGQWVFYRRDEATIREFLKRMKTEL